jgi:proteasome lid subunit RPN8/RPN11
MRATLVLPQPLAEALLAAAREPLETAGVVIARVAHLDDGTIRILGHSVHWVPDMAYRKRGVDHLSIASEGYVPALGKAESLGAAALWFHTHPGNQTAPSPSEDDAIVDTEIADLFRLRTGSDYYGTLIVSPRESGLAFTAALHAGSGDSIAIDRLWIVGDRFRLTAAFDAASPESSPAYDRNIRAFGGDIQRTLHDLTVGVVGCGGTGSSVAEQLARLGVRRFKLLDPDTLSDSNITRVYGSAASDVGRPKVEVLAGHLEHIAPGLRCERVKAMLTTEDAARRLTGCDVIFGCTDDNAGRLVLSRIATYFMTPVIDCGVLLGSDENGRLTGIDGRVTVMAPGHACLVCRGRIDVARAAAELMTPDERKRREDEGYAPALGRVEPAVVAFTTAVAAAAVSELLERFIGYGPEPRPSEVLLRFHDREISGNIAVPRERHYCHPASGKLGLGVTKPFLEQAWPE